MPARKKQTSKKQTSKTQISPKQIIRAIQAVARKLGRAPIQAEFARMSRIDVAAVKHHFRRFPAAVRAAGLRSQAGHKVDSADMLQNWAEVARRLGHLPSYKEYCAEGRYGATIFQKRFGGWAITADAFLRFAEAGSLNEEWTDVTEMVRKDVASAKADDSWHSYRSAPNGLLPMRQPLPVAVAGKRCVTATMLGVFVAEVTGIQFWSTGVIFNRRVLPDRPLLGPPMQRTSMAYEPVNEMGVIMLFSMWAERLGFVIEFAQAKFPDCKAKMEVEPGRWQDVGIEFEMYSANFKEHGHEAKKCDLIICWKHNWPDCPEEIMVLEMSKVVGG
jgi:hypothetical protein